MTNIILHPTHPSTPLHFIATLCNICYTFTHDPHELAYIQPRDGQGLSSQYGTPINATWTWTLTPTMKSPSNPPLKKPACASAVYSAAPFCLPSMHSTHSSKTSHTGQRQTNHHQTSSTTVKVLIPPSSTTNDPAKFPHAESTLAVAPGPTDYVKKRI